MYIPTKCEKSVLEFFKKKQIKTLTKEQIAEFAPGKDDYVLVSRLTDGSSVTFASLRAFADLRIVFL